MGPKIISLIGGIPFLPGPLEQSSTVLPVLMRQEMYTTSSKFIPVLVMVRDTFGKLNVTVIKEVFQGQEGRRRR